MKYIILILVLMFSVSLYAEGSDVYRGLQKIERSEIFRSGNKTRKEKNMTEAQTFAKCTAYPNPFYYEESVREFQGIPTVAVSPKGRIFLAWEAGGDHEPDPRQYLIVHYSDDEGETWSDPIYVIDCDRDRKIWVGDIQLWTSPEGDIHIYWAQDDWLDWNKDSFENNIMVPDFGKDTVRYTWRCVCKNPDSEKPVFSEPEYIFDGCMRGRPKAVKSGRIFYPTYDENKDTFIYTYSDDGGKTFVTKNGGKKIDTDGDEPEIFEREDGTIVRMQRTRTGFIGQAFSYDNGDTWTDGENSPIVAPASKLSADRLPSGNILVICNNHHNARENMSCAISPDNGKTWIYRTIDPRWETSYPDFAVLGNKIYAVWDRERVRAKEILFAVFTEKDLTDPNYKFDIKVISKSDFKNPLMPVFYPDWYRKD